MLAASPIDLIPDRVPVPGDVDGRVIVSLRMVIGVRLVPVHLRAQAAAHHAPHLGPDARARWAAAVIAVAWVAVTTRVARWAWAPLHALPR